MMKAAFSRLVPDGLAARFALLLAIALVTANLVAGLLLSSERDRLGREARDVREMERIAGLVPALEAVGPALQQAIARDASTRVARIDVAARPIVTSSRLDPRSAELSARLREALGAREVRIAILAQSAVRNRDGGEREPRRLDASRRNNGDRGPARGDQETIAISIALSGPAAAISPATWLNVTTLGDTRPQEGVDQDVFLLILGLSLAAVLGVGLLFVRHLTRPLSTLADAARAAGRGDRTARVPERGAREMREAAAAFNAMQARIARFDAERIRTVAAVGHDLRTPITSLRIRAEMLDDEAREPMVRTLEEMAVMADGLVAWSRGQGEAEETRSVELKELLKRLSQERGASFETTATPCVRGRPVALTRAFGNLIDNALRYGATARVKLSKRGDNVVVRVEDDGPGIPAERLADMFEPFVRGDDSRSTESGGAGLGLSIARTIVQAHGGHIELANVEGGGLAATVFLPLAT